MEWYFVVILVIMGVLSVFSLLVLTGVVRTRRDGVDIVLEYLKKENAELSAKVDRMEATINFQSTQISILRTQVILFESSQGDLPYPAWMFDFQGNLVSANKAFEDTFLIPIGKSIADVMGATISNVIDSVAATEYVKNHKWVLSQKRPWEGALLVNLDGRTEALSIVLYPAFSGKQIIGVSGLLIPARRIENY